MFSKKLSALAFMMAAAMLSAMPADADYIEGRTPDYYTDIRVNKPYLNFRVKAGEDVDISKMRFAIRNSAGEKIATFTGADDTMKVLDSSVLDFSDIHSAEDLSKKDFKDSELVEPFFPDKEKSTEPVGELMNDWAHKIINEDGSCYIRPDDNCYYYYTDPKKYQVVDTMTIPANTVFVDVDSKYATNNNLVGSFTLVTDKSEQSCELNDKYYFYEHAGKCETFHADAGTYDLWICGGYNGDSCEVYDKAVTYSKVRMKFTDAIPGLVEDDLTLTKEYSFSGKIFKIKYDLRGDQSSSRFTTVYHSGSAFTAAIPDNDGYVEFWMNDETMQTVMGYDFDFIFIEDGSMTSGSGGGSRENVQMPKSIEALRYKFEYPKGAYCLYGLKPDTYKLSIEDLGDSRDYRLTKSEIVISDTKDIQKADITVNKRPLLLGDVNRDGYIDVMDISIIAAYIKGIKKLDGRSPLTADVNETRDINITDVSTIAAHVKTIKMIPNKYI